MPVTPPSSTPPSRSNISDPDKTAVRVRPGSDVSDPDQTVVRARPNSNISDSEQTIVRALPIPEVSDSDQTVVRTRPNSNISDSEQTVVRARPISDVSDSDQTVVRARPKIDSSVIANPGVLNEAAKTTEFVKKQSTHQGIVAGTAHQKTSVNPLEIQRHLFNLADQIQKELPLQHQTLKLITAQIKDFLPSRGITFKGNTQDVEEVLARLVKPIASGYDPHSVARRLIAGHDNFDYEATLLNKIIDDIKALRLDNADMRRLYLRFPRFKNSMTVSLARLDKREFSSLIAMFDVYLECARDPEAKILILARRNKIFDARSSQLRAAAEADRIARENEIQRAQAQAEFEASLKPEAEKFARLFLSGIKSSPEILAQVERFHILGGQILQRGHTSLSANQVDEFFRLNNSLTELSKQRPASSALLSQRIEKIRSSVFMAINQLPQDQAIPFSDSRWVLFASNVDPSKPLGQASKQKQVSAPEENPTPKPKGKLFSWLFGKSTINQGLHSLGFSLSALTTYSMWQQWKAESSRLQQGRGSNVEAAGSLFSTLAASGLAVTSGMRWALSRRQVTDAVTRLTTLTYKWGGGAVAALGIFEFIKGNARTRSTQEYGYQQERWRGHFTTLLGDALAMIPFAPALVGGLSLAQLGRSTNNRFEAKGAAEYLAQAIITNDIHEVLERQSKIEIDQVDPIFTAIRLTYSLRDYGYLKEWANGASLAPEIRSVLQNYRNQLLERSGSLDFGESEALALIVLTLLSDEAIDSKQLAYEAVRAELGSDAQIEKSFNTFTRQGFAGPLWTFASAKHLVDKENHPFKSLLSKILEKAQDEHQEIQAELKAPIAERAWNKQESFPRSDFSMGKI